MTGSELNSPDLILQEALRREKEARDFYESLGKRCHVDFVSELLERLKEEESRHMILVQCMIERLSAGKSMV
jgi:rubrerythrin